MKFRNQLALAACLSFPLFAAPAFADDMGMAPAGNSQMAPASGDTMSAPTTGDKKDDMKKDTMSSGSTSPDSMAPETHDSMSAPNNAMKH